MCPRLAVFANEPVGPQWFWISSTDSYTTTGRKYDTCTPKKPFVDKVQRVIRTSFEKLKSARSTSSKPLAAAAKVLPNGDPIELEKLCERLRDFASEPVGPQWFLISSNFSCITTGRKHDTCTPKYNGSECPKDSALRGICRLSSCR